MATLKRMTCIDDGESVEGTIIDARFFNEFQANIDDAIQQAAQEARADSAPLAVLAVAVAGAAVGSNRRVSRRSLLTLGRSR